MTRTFALGWMLALTLAAAAEEPVSFDRDVRPLLASRCFPCHGPDGAERKARLRLDQAEGADGAYRVRGGVAAILPGSLAESELWYRITTDEPDDVMPPSDSHLERFSVEEQDTIRRWIEGGAVYESFWAFVPPERPAVPDEPAGEGGGWSDHPIDRFVLRRLVREGLTPNPTADRRTLIRRLTFDLTGLPPTRDEIHRFLADTAPGAYERLVDRLLAAPAYGEHMARTWLDLVRFADTNGLHHDHYRQMHPYRDWVIRAFNDNRPYDEFLRDQLAGDLYPQPTLDQLTASGFNRLHLIIDVGTALPEESYTRNVIDRVTAVGTAFMGLTVQCAVCHDHKYDPITARDFYQLFAFFNGFDGGPETGGRRGSDFRRGLQPPYVNLPSPEQATRLAELDADIRAILERADSLQSELLETAEEDRSPLLQAQARDEAELKQARGARDAFLERVPAAMVMRERREPRPAHILVRGAYDDPGEPVDPDTPSFLPPMREKEGRKTRMDLANWFVDPRNPLTARVAVNRFWQQLFGVGLVKTAEDFGTRGERPSHPELLDHLATSFVDSGWDVKALLKHVVMSETYRQSSQAPRERFESDPENRLLARGARFRLDAEVIRDQILATSGLLDRTMYGRSVKPPQPDGLWWAVNMPDSYPRRFRADEGTQIVRRSIYTFWKRGMPPPQMTILNAPTREACIARRERTNTPLQALLLLNEPEYLKAARHLAARELREGAVTDGERLDVLYETITARLPDESERNTLLAAVEDLRAHYRAAPDLAAELCAGVETAEPPELAAWTMLVSTLHNLDVTRTRD